MSRPTISNTYKQHTTSPRCLMEVLEDRRMFYALYGTQWASTNISVSFVPDGTALDGGYNSALFATLDGRYQTATWQREFARALQTWAKYTPLNFHFVSDDGSAQGASGSAQGDVRFGDIRLSARSTDALGFAWSPTTTTRGGDVTLSTSYELNIGSVYDLYSVLLHESGHALGMAHSTDPNAAMLTTSTRVWTDLDADDIAGIQAIYGPRLDDAFDAAARNDSLASATHMTPDATGLVAATADLTSAADVDYYSVTVPSGTNGKLTISIDARQLSLLAPAVRVYDAAGNLVASASAGDAYGGVATVSLSGLVAGQKYVIVADGASDDVFGMGSYRMNAQFGLSSSTSTTVPPTNPQPTDPPPTVTPDRYESNDNAGTAVDLGRTMGLTVTGLSVDRSTDQDYFRFVPAKNGTYVVSAAAGQGMGLGLKILDAHLHVLADGSSVTLALAAGQMYYIDITDLGGALGDYNLSLAKSSTGGGGKKGFLMAPDALYPDLGMEPHGHGHAVRVVMLKRPSALPAAPERATRVAPLVIDRSKRLIEDDSTAEID